MTVRLHGYLRALFDGCSGGSIELRAIGATGGVRARLFVSVDAILDPEDNDAIAQVVAFCREHYNCNVFVAEAVRKTAGNGTLANCGQVAALHADVDFKAFASEAEARVRVERSPYPVSIRVASGGGVQLHWLLREPIDVQTTPQLKDVLRRLAHALGGDLAAAEPARVLRVPGSRNWKYQPERTVRIEVFEPDRRYNLSDFEDLPASPEPTTASAVAVDLSKPIGHDRNVSLYRLGRGLKARGLPPAIVGEALVFVNARCCRPPLEEWEFNQILQNVLRQPDRPLRARMRVEVAADVR